MLQSGTENYMALSQGMYLWCEKGNQLAVIKQHKNGNYQQVSLLTELSL